VEENAILSLMEGNAREDAVPIGDDIMVGEECFDRQCCGKEVGDAGSRVCTASKQF
jgi:hypothetical protein